jgi:hypothetical protein
VQTVCGKEGVGVLGPVGDPILQELNTLFLTGFRTYKIATQHETKTPVKTTFRDWGLYSSFIQEKRIRLGEQSRGEGDPKGEGGGAEVQVAMARGVPKGINTQCWGSGAAGSACIWASWIRIHLSEVWIRIWLLIRILPFS